MFTVMIGPSGPITFSSEGTMGKAKYTIEYIRESFEKEGYTLLSEEYSSSERLEYICNNEHHNFVNVYNWLSGKSRCPYCSGNKKKDIEYIRNEMAKHGYDLQTDKYLNNKQYLHYICPNKHHNKIKWNVWTQGVRCPTCAKQSKPEFSDVKNSFRARGYTLLSKEYVNNRSKLYYICSAGHAGSITWSSWKLGCGCSTCGGNSKKSVEDIVKSFAKEGYTLNTDTYSNQKQKLEYKCPNGHCHSITWSDWSSGYRCPKCHSIKMSGSGNHQWCGGISFEPYCEIWKDKEYKKEIKDRDGNKCLNPYCCSANKLDIVIHHIDYNKKNCRLNNLVTVCRGCNNKANRDREWHTAWYQAVLMNRYGYKY